MKHILLLIGIFAHFNAYSQNENGPVEVTAQLEKQIRATIEKQVVQLRQKMQKAQQSTAYTEFVLDTFQVEKYMEMYMAYDFSTAGMKEATYEGAHQYDSLLNKYYKKLVQVLKKEDKQALISAQKAWITFRDNEHKLVGVLSKEEYSGGGTMQLLVDASQYLDIVKNRTITIFQHYLRANGEY